MITGRPGRPDCVHAETLSAFVDGELSPTERTMVEAHVAGCQECREALVETAGIVRAIGLSDSGESMPPERQTVRAAARSRIRAGYLGIAAALVVGVGLTVWWIRSPSPAQPTPDLAELVTAVGNQRAIQARLTGGFQWGAPPSPLRGADTARTVSPEVSIAFAHLQQRLRQGRTAEVLEAYASGALVVGRVDDAVATLEEATALAPSAQIWSDLSAAYLTRSQVPGHGADTPRALQAADTALTTSPRLLEALFNRALALEAIPLRQQAIAAWTRYLELDPSSPWAAEAKQHLATLQQKASTAFDPQTAREQLLDVLLPKWANAVQQQAGTAPALLDQARTLAERIDRASPDRFASQVVAVIPQAGASTALVEGHAAFGQARESYRLARFDDAARGFSSARATLAAAGSPLELEARLYRAASDYSLGRLNAAIPTLLQLRAAARDKPYDALKGRTEWLLGSIAGGQGHLDAAGKYFAAAVQALTRAGETSNVAFVEDQQAELLNADGNQAQSWEVRLPALAIDQRPSALLSAAQSARDIGWPEAAGDMIDEALEASRAGGQSPLLVDALRARAIAYARSGNQVAARFQLAEARQILERSFPTWDRFRAELDAAEATCVDTANEASGVSAATRAIQYFTDANLLLRVPPLLVARAQLRRASGADDEALRDLTKALAMLDRERRQVSAIDLRATFGDEVRSVADQLVQLDLDHHRDADAFEEAQVDGSVEPAGSAPSGRSRRISLQTLQELLAPHVVVVVFNVSATEVRAWNVRRGGAFLARTPVAKSDLSRLIETLATGENQTFVANRLRDLLLTPIDRDWTRDDVIVLIPDSPLGLLPFAMLPGREHGFLVEENALLTSPSLAAFVNAARRAAQFSSLPRVVTAIGNPSIDRRAYPTLPDLPDASDEARVIAGLYERSTVILGDAATRLAVISALSQSEVVHFGGHSILNDLRPMQSQLVIADPTGNGVTAGDIVALHTARVRLVVLATCQAASGLLTRTEGPIGIARAFLFAGVPAVVASYWPVPDQAAMALLVQFHKAYVRTGDPVLALRRAQVEMLETGNPSLTRPEAWAGFSVIGGWSPALNVVTR